MKIKNDISAKKPSSKGALPFTLSSTDFHQNVYDYQFTDIQESKIVDWPMVYILTNDNARQAYVGQTTNIVKRLSEHKKDPEKQIFKKATIIDHDEFNGSVITDYEHRLIMYMAADGKYKLTNKNEGWYDRNYFSKEEYSKMYENLWENLRKNNLAQKTIKELEETEIFKYSPYKELNNDQERALESILEIIKSKFSETKESHKEKNKAPIVVKSPTQ